MNWLLPLLIVAMAPEAPIEARYPEAAAVFHCTFDASWDANFDQWPDDWTRRRGPQFPHYVGIKVDPQSSPEGAGCLRVELDGGAAVAYSPPIEIDPQCGYVLEGYLKTEGLDRDRAWFSITLLDAQRQRLETCTSEKVRQTSGWQKLRLGPIAPDRDDARLAIVGLHVQSESLADLKGTVLFDDVWLGRLPRLDLSTTAAHNFFDQADRVEVTCAASGLVDLEAGARATLRLEDVEGRELARVDRALEPPSLDATMGQTLWQPPIPGPGFYRIRATMRGRRGLVLEREVTVAVFDAQQPPADGEFGWTLPRGDRPLPLPVLTRLIGQAGIHWVKYPLWYDSQRGKEQTEELITFGEQLGQQRIELVGLLDEPPRPAGADDDLYRRPVPAAEVFASAPATWYPMLEPVISRLAARVRWWQLGDDHDTSFVDCPNLAGKLAGVRTELDRIGRDVNLGIGWGWLDPLPLQPAGGKTPLQFLTLSADPPMAAEELATYLDATARSAARRWVVVEPLPRASYAVEVRAADLARRMIAAKIHGADAVFCPDPFGDQRGLINDDGTPGELLFTWRTVARTLGGAEYLGSLELPSGSPNQLFARGGEVVMVVWNREPTDEVLYLGEDVRQIDLFGRVQRPGRQGDCQVIHAGELPSFVTGVNEPITRWRLDCAFAQQNIPSLFNRPSQNALRLTNHFDRNVVGRATLVTPESWKVDPSETTFWLAEGEAFEQGFSITLPHNADSGSQPVRLDFEVEAERTYRFSVYRRIAVGLGDVSVEIRTRLNDRGELEVRQRLVNQTAGAVSFRCELFAPGRRRQQTQVIDLRPGRDEQVYVLADGRSLVGETLWLRAEEVGGSRILNYRFPAGP